MSKYIRAQEKNQEGILPGLVRLVPDKYDWRKQKLKTYRLSHLYELAGEDRRSKLVAFCSTYLTFGVTQGGKRFLRHANFCRDRLCPMCTARKARNMVRDLSRILEHVEAAHTDVRYIFLTLTIRNVDGCELPEALTRLTKSFDRLRKHKAFERAIKGFFRSIEITRNNDRGSKDYGTYHPHIHAVLAVTMDYFDPLQDLYLDHEWYVKHWRRAVGAGYDPDVSISRARAGKKKTADAQACGQSAELAAAQEAAKYPLKSEDYINTNLEEDEAVKVILDYLPAVKGRRFTAFGGWLKEAAAALKLEALEDMNDLTDVNNQEIRDDLCVLVQHYRWTFGAKDYIFEDEDISPEARNILDSITGPTQPQATGLEELPALTGTQLLMDGYPSNAAHPY